MYLWVFGLFGVAIRLQCSSMQMRPLDRLKLHAESMNIHIQAMNMSQVMSTTVTCNYAAVFIGNSCEFIQKCSTV